MELKTRILATPSPELHKQLLCCFDHQVEVVLQPNEVKSASNGVNELDIEDLLNKFTQHQQKRRCVIAYKLLLNLACLRQLIYSPQNSSNWQSKISEYDPKTKRIIEKECFSLNSRENRIDEEWQRMKKNQESTFIVDLLNNRQQLVRIYFLPFSKESQKEETQVTRARHQNFKLFKIIKEYVSLECNCDTPLVFDQQILNHLAAFLYLEDVRHIEIVVWLQHSMFDHSLLKQIGEIKLPQPWLDKVEYRRKKKEIYDLKMEEFNLITTLKGQKQGFIENIATVQQIAGLPVQSYSEISLQSFKKIRHESLIQKTVDIKDLQAVLLSLQIRSMNLQKKKEEYMNKKMLNEKQRIHQILVLKQQISLLQGTPGMQTDNNFGLIYSRVNRVTEDRNVKTAIVGEDKRLMPKWSISDSNQYVDNRESEKTQKTLPMSSMRKKIEFKHNVKKVTSVVRGTKSQLKVNTKKLRQDYQTQILKIDFEMEKKYVEMLGRYEKACQQLNGIMDDNDGLDI